MTTTSYYEVNVNWLSERKGIAASPVLNTTIEVATPLEFPKGMAGIWSPEHLFVAAINACLMTTFLSISENSKLEFESFSSKATGKLELLDGKYMITEVVLLPVLTVINAHDLPKAKKVLEKSEINCLISNSVKSTIIFKPEVRVKSAAIL